MMIIGYGNDFLAKKSNDCEEAFSQVAHLAKLLGHNDTSSFKDDFITFFKVKTMLEYDLDSSDPIEMVSFTEIQIKKDTILKIARVVQCESVLSFFESVGE